MYLAGGDEAMVEHINKTIADGTWILGITHYYSPYVENAVNYFKSELGVDLTPVRIMYLQQQNKQHYFING